MIHETYEFASEEQRLLGKVVVPHKSYNLSEGEEFILAPTTGPYHHPKNVYVYDKKTNRFCGRYNIAWFEVLGEYESEEVLREHLQVSEEEPASGNDEKKKVIEEKKEVIEEEQLSLF